MKKVTRIRVERIEVPDNWKQPTNRWVEAVEPVTPIKREDRMTDFYFTDNEAEPGSSEIWPVMYNIDIVNVQESLILMGALFESAGAMIRFSRLTNVTSGRFKE